MNKKYIVVSTQFEALHHWPECPYKELSFLRSCHRHIFHVVVKWLVQHNDRDKEFIFMKRAVESFCTELVTAQQGDLGRSSCEDIADLIHTRFPDCCFVSVFEDGENGVEAYYEPKEEIHPGYMDTEEEINLEGEQIEKLREAIIKT